MLCYFLFSMVFGWIRILRIRVLNTADMHMMHKIMHGGGGLDHQTWFTKGSDSGRATRSTADPLNVTVKNGRLDIRSKFLSVRAPAQWNAVPSDIKQLQPAQRSKTAYKQFKENPV